MSRIGRKIIALPKGITVQTEGLSLVVKGPKGTLRIALPHGVQLEKHGVGEGFQKHLDIVGIGYRAESKGKSVTFTLGYSHPIEFEVPEGVAVAVEKQTHLIVSGADKQLVGHVAAKIRSLRPPDPYKNKGVRYTGERLKKKVGKAAAAAGGGKAG